MENNNYHLTKKEIEVLSLIADGNKNSAIGEKLFIARRTVDSHMTNLLKKLKLKSTRELICFAVSNKKELEKINGLVLW